MFSELIGDFFVILLHYMVHKHFCACKSICTKTSRQTVKQTAQVQQLASDNSWLDQNEQFAVSASEFSRNVENLYIWVARPCPEKFEPRSHVLQF